MAINTAINTPRVAIKTPIKQPIKTAARELDRGMAVATAALMRLK
jgi:hypothetical protein